MYLRGPLTLQCGLQVSERGEKTDGATGAVEVVVTKVAATAGEQNETGDGMREIL